MLLLPWRCFLLFEKEPNGARKVVKEIERDEEPVVGWLVGPARYFPVLLTGLDQLLAGHKKT